MKTQIENTVHLNRDVFEKDLDICLIIIDYPTKRKAYYVCEYTSPSLKKSLVRVYVRN